MKIKICGLTRPEDIICVNRLRPDYIGFVFWPKSRRFLGRAQAARLKALLSLQFRRWVFLWICLWKRWRDC